MDSIEDILNKDSLNEIIRELEEVTENWNKLDIVVVGWEDDDGHLVFRNFGDRRYLVSFLERIKYYYLKKIGEDEEGDVKDDN
ncbi:hypothetical protein LCGC14_1282450 [marine sediment metagenome]|uniref:Uncharacterized protein n=1 Tax=marine sediment metagenome TaxID=412755 RepID=A0A0F9KUT1_9ZZZZ